jgi:hypothetical protein
MSLIGEKNAILRKPDPLLNPNITVIIKKRCFLFKIHLYRLHNHSADIILIKRPLMIKNRVMKSNIYRSGDGIYVTMQIKSIQLVQYDCSVYKQEVAL